MRADAAKGVGPGKIALAAAWYAVLIAIAVVAVGLQLDRQARYDPALGALVPKAFRGDSLEALARSAFDRNDPSEGEALARELLERRPVPAEGLSLYATGLLANGKSDMAASVLQVAAGRGWRDRFVQHVVIASALQNGEPAVAAQRVIGLWRQGERADWLKDVTRTTLGERDGFAAFAAALSDGDNDFGANFLAWSATSLPAASVDRLARDLARNRTRFDCAWFSHESNRLVRDGRHDAAMAIWSAFCAGSRRTKINDMRFDESVDEPGPFGWRYPENAGVDTQISDDDGNLVLHYSNTDPLYHVIARRYLALSPGHYVLATDETTDTSAARWQIACIGSGATSHVIQLEEIREGLRPFIVQAGCTVQELTIAARLSTGEIGRIAIWPDGR